MLIKFLAEREVQFPWRPGADGKPKTPTKVYRAGSVVDLLPEIAAPLVANGIAIELPVEPGSHTHRQLAEEDAVRLDPPAKKKGAA